MIEDLCPRQSCAICTKASIVKNGNLLLKTEVVMLYQNMELIKEPKGYFPEFYHVTLQYPANFLHFLQSENIGSPDGDPIITTSLSGWEYIDLLMFLSDYTMYSIIYRVSQKTCNSQGHTVAQYHFSRLI